MDDNDHLYIAGKDLYPREGLEPTKTRIKELSTKKNLIGEPCIRKICKKYIVLLNYIAIVTSKRNLTPKSNMV